MRRERAVIGNKTLSYLMTEPARAPVRQQPVRTIVLLHAFPLQAAMWEGTMTALPDGWRAIAPDYRGFGETPLVDSASHGMGDLAGDVIDLLDRLEITQAVFAGCSMGGYVLFEIFKAAPRYVSAAVLVSTRPGADSDEGRANRTKMIAQVEREGVEAVGAQMVPKLLGKTTQSERPDLMKRAHALIVGNARDGITAAVRAMMERGDSTPLLPKIDVPVLVVHGQEDVLIPPSEGEGMHRAIRHSRLALLADAGHLPNLEQPAAFDAALHSLLSTL